MERPTRCGTRAVSVFSGSGVRLGHQSTCKVVVVLAVVLEIWAYHIDDFDETPTVLQPQAALGEDGESPSSFTWPSQLALKQSVSQLLLGVVI